MKKTTSKFSDRVKRFFRGLTAQIKPSDLEIINRFLEDNHKKVFFSMSIVDQRHCLDVTKTLLNSKKTLNLDTIRLALLHDIGKQVKYFSLVERSLVVLFPRKRLKTPAYPVTGNLLKKAWQLKYWHPEYGRKIAKEADFDIFLTDLIHHHHTMPPKTPEIELFQWSDNLN